MKITADLFNAYLDCPTKSWLRGRGETSSGNLYSHWAASQEQVYRREGFNRLLRDIPSADHVIAPTKLLNCRPPKWRMVLDVSVQVFSTESCLLESRIDALERVSSEGSSKRAREMRFVPIRFVFANKVTKKERLLLGFDALVLSQALKSEVREGRIIHGDQYTARKIVATALADETQKLILRLEALLASHSPPDLVLNRHCAKCEFQGRCRKQAIEKDELTLLAGMTEKERKKLHSKGIFTVTQLSYTFRPRKMGRHAANKPEKHLHPVKALAIREKKIHLVGNPELRIDGTPVYVDVEGLPDRDFYYLIGVRPGHGDSQVHTLWADSASDERTIWKRFIRVLGTVTNPVLVHYGSYESNFFKRMYERHGGPPTGSDLARSMKSSVNLLSLLSRSVYLPTYSNTLKDTASFFGASWQWSDASGIQAIAQRYEWERTRSQTIKERLLKYNQDDCAALEVLALGVANVLAESKSRPDIDFAYSPKKVETGSGVEIHKTFNSFLRAAHFDYVRGKIKLHTRGDALPVPLIPRLKRRPARRELPSRGGRIIRVPRKRKCPRHPEHPSMLRPCSKDREHAYLDIAFTRTGCKKVIVRYRGKQSRCPHCNSTYPPPQVKEIRHRVHGEGFEAWVVYLRVALRMSYRLIVKFTRDLFAEEISTATVERFIKETAKRHEMTERLSLTRMLQSPAIHVDETKINILGIYQQVWVITNGREVLFRLTRTRETNFLAALLTGYQGVLVSDFYGGYDAIPCRQQKCLVHLIRDLNDDLWKNPFNAEYERFVLAVRDLFVPIFKDVERYGLKVRHLRKHRSRTDHFYMDAVNMLSQQESVAKYQKRFQRYRAAMFTFLDDDGIPWNNNPAERALRHLAVQRKISGAFSENGAEDYLRLLAVAQTCRFQNKSFLDFLLSGCTDVDQYKQNQRHRTSPDKD